jgi:hypothetical protein
MESQDAVHVGPERRRHTRIAGNFTLRYRFDGYSWDMTTARNVSAGGLLFTVLEMPLDSHALDLVLKMPHRPQEVRARAAVVRVENPSAGANNLKNVAAEFTDIEAQERKFIDDVANRRVAFA